jgi:hypothetical protein
MNFTSTVNINPMIPTSNSNSKPQKIHLVLLFAFAVRIPRWPTGSRISKQTATLACSVQILHLQSTARIGYRITIKNYVLEFRF